MIYNQHRKTERAEQGKYIEKFFLGEILRSQYLKVLGMTPEQIKEKNIEDFNIYEKILKEREPRYEDKLRLMKETQRWSDATNPKNQYARELRILVAKGLMGDNFDNSRLLYYTALETHLDIFNQTDAMFEYYDKSGKNLICRLTFDLKTTVEIGGSILNISESEADDIEEKMAEIKQNSQKFREMGEISEEAQNLKKEIEIKKDILMEKIRKHLNKWSKQIVKGIHKYELDMV